MIADTDQQAKEEKIWNKMNNKKRKAAEPDITIRAGIAAERKKNEARRTTIKQWDRHRVELLDDGQGKNKNDRSKQRVRGGSRREGDTGPRARREGTKEHAADSLHDPECRAEADISNDSGCHPVKHLGDAVLEKMPLQVPELHVVTHPGGSGTKMPLHNVHGVTREGREEHQEIHGKQGPREHEGSNGGGLSAPVMDDGGVVTGANKERHRTENKAKRKEKQAMQSEVDYWSYHEGKFTLPPTIPAPDPKDIKGAMCPKGLAMHHEAADYLLSYASGGCPVKTGKPWSREMIEAAIENGAHKSAMVPEAMKQLAEEVAAKAKKGQCRVVLWEDIKSNPPEELKVSPIAMIPHKSRMFRAILDLSFRLRLKNGTEIQSVNESTEKTAPHGAIDQLGHSLMRLIHAFAQAKPEDKIFTAKWDVKDGFWRLDGEVGQEWNFAYVLPQAPGEPIKLVIPTSLQMGWIESPPYFCAASETARDVGVKYIETPVGSLPKHKFLKYAAVGEDFESLPITTTKERFPYTVEIYVDDFVGMAIPASQEQLEHVATGIMMGAHDVFPEDENDEEDPLSLKKMKKFESMWALKKDVLGFTFDGLAHTIWLEAPKRDMVLLTLKKWLRSARKGYSSIPFVEFQSIISKLRHAFISIPNGKGLLSPCNTIMRGNPSFVHLHKHPLLLQAIDNCRTLVRESTVAPTKCIELVAGWPDFVGVKDASGHGVGGVIFGENEACVPTVFRFEWPNDIKADLNTEKNPTGSITNSDLECAGLLMLFLIMEDVCEFKSGSHAALFSDNQPTFSWVDRLASKSSEVAGQLIRALALRLSMSGVSPLTTLHVKGTENAMTDIPSRSWGSVPKWHCKTCDDLLHLFNKTFPLPEQASWTVYSPSKEITMRVLSVLRTKRIGMDEWRRLPKRGRNTTEIGVPLSHLWEWTLRYRLPPISTKCDASADLQRSSELASMVEENKSKLEQSLARSRPLARRSPWTTK